VKRAKQALVVLAVVAAGVFFAQRVQQTSAQQAEAAKKGGKKGAARIVTVSVAEARTGQVRQELLLTGALRPKEQVEVTAKAMGRVDRLRFQLGDAVKKGEMIAELEDGELQQQVSRARAALAVARAATKQRQAELESSKANFGRAESLMKSGLIPASDFESRRTAWEVVQAQVELARAQEGQAQAEIRELEIRLAQTKVYAPMDGLVARRHIDQGTIVTPSMPILTLVNLSTMVTMAGVPEQDVGRLRVGGRARVEVDAYGEQAFEGRVARIGPVLDPATRSATVEVEIANADGRLKAEMFARVTLDMGATRAAVIIPRDGLVYRGSQPGVFLIERSRSTFHAIETGQTMGSDVEVLANLAPGTRIATRGSAMLREGDQVKIVEGGEVATSPSRGPGEGGKGKGKGRKNGRSDGE
jgi:RND family efflux transporter MFP subunit